MRMEKRSSVNHDPVFSPCHRRGAWLMSLTLALLAGWSAKGDDSSFVVKLPGGVNLEMVKIQAGTFEMGIPDNSLGFNDNNDKNGKNSTKLPAKLHRVTLTKDYWLGVYEVTQAQWESVMRACNPQFKLGKPKNDFLTKYKAIITEGTTERIEKNVELKKYVTIKKDGNSWEWRPNVANSIYEKLYSGYYKACPMEMVSWHDAKEFCKRLNELYRGRLPKGYHFDLPTEAQWEYACRAGTTTSLNTGQELTAATGPCYNLHEAGWYSENSKDHTDALPARPKSNDKAIWELWDGDNVETPHKIGGKRPNRWGLYDMHGNVNEWCRDNNENEADYASDPEFFEDNGKGINELRVYRGGSFRSNPIETISGYRRAAVPSKRDATIGFRLALVPDSPQKMAVTKGVNDGRIKVDLPKGEIMTFEKISAGTFTMGSPKKEWGRSSYEQQHEVTLTKDFWLGTYEVTQAQWMAVTGGNPSFIREEGENNQEKRNKCPVDSITWNAAKEFCETLNVQCKSALPRGYHFDLPTEAQWEYACRAGTRSALNSGTDLTKAKFCFNLDTVGWFAENSGKPQTTREVGSKLPNKWGLYDMHGNVAEWCRDIYEDYKTVKDSKPPYNITGVPVTDPTGGKEGRGYREHVYRGGGCKDNSRSCRSAFRFHEPKPNYSSECLGLRVAIVPDDK